MTTPKKPDFIVRFLPYFVLRNLILFNTKAIDIEVTSWLVSADDFSSRVARGANERVSAANE